jgi:hypothetical protein
MRPQFAPTDEAFHKDVGIFVRASQALLTRVNGALQELDLLDVRKV